MKLLLLGPEGQVGWELQRSLAPLGEVLVASRGTGGDLADLAALRATVRRLRPDAIINAAAYTAVDAAEAAREVAGRINAEAPGALGEEAASLGELLIHYSTDYVFDGSGARPWQETDRTAPLNAYGATKCEGEERIRASGCRHLILRTSWVYASRGKNFVRTMLRLGAERESLSVVDDQTGAPTGADLIADVTAQLLPAALARPATLGTYHLAAAGETSWCGFARHIFAVAREAGFPLRMAPEGLRPCATADYPTPARRPLNSRLCTDRLEATFGLAMPAWQSGVTRAVRELTPSA